MIENMNSISDFSTDSPEGKLLLAALAILTSIDHRDITNNKWGGMVHPDDALQKVCDLANKIYFEKEYEQYKQSKLRDSKIEQILPQKSFEK